MLQQKKKLRSEVRGYRNVFQKTFTLLHNNTHQQILFSLYKFTSARNVTLGKECTMFIKHEFPNVDRAW